MLLFKTCEGQSASNLSPRGIPFLPANSIIYFTKLNHELFCLLGFSKTCVFPWYVNIGTQYTGNAILSLFYSSYFCLDGEYTRQFYLGEIKQDGSLCPPDYNSLRKLLDNLRLKSLS